MKICELYDLDFTLAKSYLKQFEYPWNALDGLKNFIASLCTCLDGTYKELSEGVFVHESANVHKSATILSPCVIGEGSDVRTGAYIRGSVLIGKGCVVGNSCEVKNAVLFDGVHIPHFNYVGDSILGYKAHFGAGAITSNLKCDGTQVTIDRKIQTNRRKVGAFVGDLVEVGCNSVLNPGTVVGKNTVIYPLSCVRGVVPENSIYKNGQIKKRLY